jgi:predicted methyltransferase
MSIRSAFLAATVLIAGPALAADAIQDAVASPQRSAANVARDKWRHPTETLRFFGIRPTMTVVEIWPSAGWYAEILAPMLRDRGRYVAALQANPKYREMSLKLFASDPARFGKAVVATFDPKSSSEIVPAGSADAVLTFRNIHNLLMSGNGDPERAFAQFYRVLKPGGVLGVVDHRLPEGRDAALEQKNGYIKRSTIIRLATQAGFKLAAESQVNANPKDPADGPVWRLPPTLREGDKDRDRYLAIGESDRMTLKFVKPQR